MQAHIVDWLGIGTGSFDFSISFWHKSFHAMPSLHCLSNFAIQLLVYWQLAPIQQHAHVVQLTKRYLPMLPAFNEGTEMLEKTSSNVVSINQTLYSHWPATNQLAGPISISDMLGAQILVQMSPLPIDWTSLKPLNTTCPMSTCRLQTNLVFKCNLLGQYVSTWLIVMARQEGIHYVASKCTLFA